MKRKPMGWAVVAILVAAWIAGGFAARHLVDLSTPPTPPRRRTLIQRIDNGQLCTWVDCAGTPRPVLLTCDPVTELAP